MKKLISVLVIALALTGCTYGNEVICTSSGELMIQLASDDVGQSAQSLRNTVQTCINTPEGDILIKRVK